MKTNKLKIFVLFLALAFVCAAASAYSVTLYQPGTLAGKQLKAGDYKLTLDGDKVIISKGKEQVEATAKVETAGSKFTTTSVRYVVKDGANNIREISLGGTTTRLVFE